MSVETEPLKLKPYQLAEIPGEGWVITPEGGAPIPIPAVYHSLFQLVAKGKSLAQIADGMRLASRRGRFTLLARFLGFLAENDLLADPKALRLAESLLPDYTWKQSLAFEDLFSLELFRVKGSVGNSQIAQVVVAIVLIAMGIDFFSRFLDASFKVQQDFMVLENAWPVVIAFVFTFSIGRSLAALGQFWAIKFSGASAGVRLRADCVSVSLGTDDLSSARGDVLFIASGLVSLVWLVAPVSIAPLVGLGTLKEYVVVFSGLLFLADVCPFRKSSFTEWLRSFYNFEDRNGAGENWRAEELVKKLHLAGLIIWSVFLALWLAVPGWSLAAHLKNEIFLQLKSQAGESSREIWISTAIISIALGLILLSFIDDIIDGVKSHLSDSPRRVRRIWRRRGRQMSIAAAIQKGRAPAMSELEKLPLLRQIDPAIRTELLKTAKLSTFKAGSYVCHHGDQDRHLFILLSGKLAVAKSSPSGKRRVVAVLGPGSVFGEVAFFFGEKRTADVIAVEESHVLVIQHDSGMAKVTQEKSSELQVRVWFLQALVSKSEGGFLRDLPGEALDSLIHAGEKVTLYAGQRVFSEGEKSDACYFIVQGQVSIVQNTRLINRLSAGDVIGEISLLQPGTLRTATVIADSDLILIRIENEKFWKLICSHLPLALEIERLAEARLVEDTQRSMTH